MRSPGSALTMRGAPQSLPRSSSPRTTRSGGSFSTTASCHDAPTDAASRSRPLASGLSALNRDQIAERGAWMARRDDREYREYLREEQRGQPGCPVREVVPDQRGQATRLVVGG